MANVGDQLTQPEAGWRRYDDSDGRFTYYGTWALGTSTSHFKERAKYTLDTVSTVSFKFTGTKLRIISFVNSNQSPNVGITIDGENYSYSLVTASDTFMVLVFEKLNLSSEVHTVSIKSNATGTFNFDAIDIDSTGELLSIPPPTTGKLCNTLDEMDIGDYIVWKRDGNTHSFGGTIDGYTEVPVTGVASSSLPTKHFHYAIKVDTGLLISDRVTEHSITWDALNSSKRIQGLPTIISGVSGVIRSLTGGVAYADENGNKSLTNKGFGGFPINNEWDKYVVKFPSSLVQEGKTLDDVFHWSSCSTMTQDTLAQGFVNSDGVAQTGTNASTRRFMRGHVSFNDGIFFMSTGLTTATWTNAGWRPVFEYKEV